MFKGLIPYIIPYLFVLASALGITPTTIPQDPLADLGDGRVHEIHEDVSQTLQFVRRIPEGNCWQSRNFSEFPTVSPRMDHEWTMDQLPPCKTTKINKPDFLATPQKDRNGSILHHLNGILQKTSIFSGCTRVAHMERCHEQNW